MRDNDTQHTDSAGLLVCVGGYMNEVKKETTAPPQPSPKGREHTITNGIIAPKDRVDPELMGVIKRSVRELQEQHDGKNYICTYDQVWIAKSIQEAGWVKANNGTTPLPPFDKGGITNREKTEFVIEKVIWEWRKRMESTGGKLSTSWEDMERKARLILNEFGKGLPNDINAQLLINMMALFIDAMYKWGKWEAGDKKQVSGKKLEG